MEKPHTEAELWNRIDATVLSRPKHELLMEGLRMKEAEYERRVPDPNSQSGYCLFILRYLRINIECSGSEIVAALRIRWGRNFDPVAFAAALHIIHEYSTKGYCGESILPGLEGIVQLPQEESATPPEQVQQPTTGFRKAAEMLLPWFFKPKK